MKCPSCGFENEEGSRFCQSCGGNLGEAAGDAGGAPPPKEASPPPAPPSAPPPKGSGEIDIGGWISQGFSEVFSDIGNYLLLGLVVGIVSGVTVGILAGPLFAGSFIVIRRKLRGEGAIDIGAVFNEGFAHFGNTFVLVFPTFLGWEIVTGILAPILVIGQIVSLLIIAFLFPFWAFGCYYITEEGQDFGKAFSSAFEIYQRNLVMIWLYGLLTAIIMGVGVIACGVGLLVTIPVGLVMLALLLDSIFPKK